MLDTAVVDLRCDSAAVGGHGPAFRAYVAHGDPPAGSDPRSLWCRTWSPHEAMYDDLDEPVAGARMIRCLPQQCGGAAALSEWTIDPLAAVLSELARPLAIDLDSVVPFDLRAVFDLAVRHPLLSVVLRLNGDWHAGLLLALVRNTHNIYLETSGLDCDTIGRAAALDAGRLLFGSGCPDREPDAELDRLSRALPDRSALVRVVATTAVDLLGLSDT